MEKELRHIQPVQAGKILAILYGIIGIIMLPFFLLTMALSPRGIETTAPMLIMIFLYPVMGFLGGIIMAALYNLVAKWVGGLRFTLEEHAGDTLD